MEGVWGLKPGDALELTRAAAVAAVGGYMGYHFLHDEFMAILRDAWPHVAGGIIYAIAILSGGGKNDEDEPEGSH